jgi:pimeloyl-ACP methyl ester carboxylesterase
VAAHPKPTLIVWGERDLILPATHLAAAQAAFPHAKTHLFADTGHMPQIERADEFADLTRLFLTAHSSAV